MTPTDNAHVRKNGASMPPMRQWRDSEDTALISGVKTLNR